jgi:type IV secretion system protein TrbL
MQPSAVLGQGANLAAKLFNQTSVLHPGAAVGAALCAVAIFGLFAITAGLMLLSLAKAFVTVGIGVLFLAFAGSTFTIGSAMNVLWMTIAAGARLFVIELIAGLGSMILQALGGTNTPLGQDNMWGVAGLGIVYLILIFSLPSMAEHMANGTGHARVGPGELMRFGGQTIMLASGAGAAANALGSAGKSMLDSLSGSRSLPPPSSGSSGGAAAASAGMSMRPRS